MSDSSRVVYLDASAIVKLVIAEKETASLIEYLAGADCVSSEIAEVEVLRAAYLRTGAAESVDRAEAVLRKFNLVALDDQIRRDAARARPADLRTLDAIHLASCVRLAKQLDAVVAYDRRLAHALRANALRVDAPPEQPS